MNCSPGKLRALVVVPECQNRPSGETSHSNWWLCIRHMHFYRVIHLPSHLVLLPLFLAVLFLHCHYFLLPHSLSLTLFFTCFGAKLQTAEKEETLFILLTPAIAQKCTQLYACAPACPPPAHLRKTIWKTRSWQRKWLHRPCIHHKAAFLLRIIRIRLIPATDSLYVYVSVCMCVFRWWGNGEGLEDRHRVIRLLKSWHLTLNPCLT